MFLCQLIIIIYGLPNFYFKGIEARIHFMICWLCFVLTDFAPWCVSLRPRTQGESKTMWLVCVIICTCIIKLNTSYLPVGNMTIHIPFTYTAFQLDPRISRLDISVVKAMMRREHIPTVPATFSISASKTDCIDFIFKLVLFVQVCCIEFISKLVLLQTPDIFCPAFI